MCVQGGGGGACLVRTERNHSPQEGEGGVAKEGLGRGRERSPMGQTRHRTGQSGVAGRSLPIRSDYESLRLGVDGVGGMSE